MNRQGWKTKFSRHLIFTTSGMLMFFWVFYFFGFEKIILPEYFSKVQPLLLTNLPAKALALSASVSWMVAVSALPEREI